MDNRTTEERRAYFREQKRKKRAQVKGAQDVVGSLVDNPTAVDMLVDQLVDRLVDRLAVEMSEIVAKIVVDIQGGTTPTPLRGLGGGGAPPAMVDNARWTENGGQPTTERAQELLGADPVMGRVLRAQEDRRNYDVIARCSRCDNNGFVAVDDGTGAPTVRACNHA